MGLSRAFILRQILLASLFFVLGFTYSYLIPKLESFLVVEIERQSRAHLPLRIIPKAVHLRWAPLGISLTQVRMEPKAPLNRYLADTEIAEVGVDINLISLITGQIRLSRVFLRDSEFQIFLREELFKGRQTSTSMAIDFNQIYALPVDEIQLENISAQGRIEPQNLVFKVTGFDLNLENRFKSLFVESSSKSVLFKPSGPQKALKAEFEIRALVEANQLQISALKVKADDSFVVASGQFDGQLGSGRLDDGRLSLRTKIQLQDVNVWELAFFQQPRVPRLAGSTELDADLVLKSGQPAKAQGHVKAKDLEVDKFRIGQIDATLESDLKSIQIAKLNLNNRALEANLEKFRWNPNSKPQIDGQVKIARVEIRALLEELGVKRVPFVTPASGEMHCQADLQPSFQLDCKATAQIERFFLQSGPPKNAPLVEFTKGHLQGQVKVDKTHVEFQSEAQLGQHSKGRASGSVDYEKGFQIAYEADHLAFADIKNLINLKFEGFGQVKGTTNGTAKWGVVDLQFSGDQLWLENYPLGQAKTQITYKAGHLRLDNIVGQLGVTRFNGLFAIDIPKERLELKGQVPFMDLKDIKHLFSRKIQLPFDMNGTGTGQIEAEGPFRFNELTYKFRSNFFRGQIAGESFDDLTFHVAADHGNAKSEKIFLTKAQGAIEMKGVINPKGEIDAVAVGRGLRLEQSENLNALRFDVQGLTDFSLLVKGQLPHPKVELNGRMSRLVLADQPADDSVFKLNFMDDRMEGSGQFLGSKILGEFIFPYTTEAPFLFKLKTRSWDFSNLFSLVSRSAQTLDFSTSVSMDVDLKADRGGFWNSTGQAVISEFSLKKSSKALVAKKPMRLLFKSGQINSDNFAITSGDDYLKLDVANASQNNLNASLNGKFDIGLLGLFTPFISDLRGLASVTMDLRGSFQQPKLSGSAYIDKAYVKFVDFYHPFANIKADLIFNDNQIVVNSLRSDFAGGKGSGEGRITFNRGNRPVQFRGLFNDIKINIPEGFRTTGSGTLGIVGDNFPYTMEINYDIVGGEVVYEIGEDAGTKASVKASAFLPRFTDQDAFHPFTFQTDINLKNPLLVNNSMFRSYVSGRVKASGTPDRLLMTGTMTPQPGGKFYFRDTPFDVGSSFVEYNNSPPNDPKIYLTATARVTESITDGQQRTIQNQYDISLLVQGRGQDPKIILSSQPSLGQREIVSLLALGVTGQQVENRNVQDSQTANTSAAVGAALLQKAGGKKVKESLGVDVKVSSSQATQDNASSPRVTLSKQWTPKFGASASSTLESNPNNTVKLEYKMNQKLSVIGSWDGRENLRDQQRDATRNVFGLDLQYKVPFK